MPERRHRRMLSAVLTCAVAAVMTGCASIPTNGPIVQATATDRDGPSDVRIDAQPPQPGASPTDIVNGFLDAMSRYELGFGLAEQFLTPDARDGWDRRSIEVYNSNTVVATQPSIVKLRYDQVAHIDETGRYEGVLDSEPKEFTLRLEQDEAGEWRLVNPPDFLLISSFDLGRSYGPFVTYFPDPNGDVLVPDQVWLPTVEPQIALLLAQAVVDGPTELLGPRGVANPFPPDTRVESAVVSGPVLTVALTGPTIAETDEATRELMLAQLTATIDLPNVERVDLTIGGEIVDVTDISGQLDALTEFNDPPAYLLSETDALLEADSRSAAEFTQVPGPLGRGEVPSRSFAVSLDRTVAATVSMTGTEVYRTPLADAGVPEMVLRGDDIAPPSFDRYGNVWVVDRGGAGETSELRVVQPDGSVLAVAAPDLAGERVNDLRIAPDGVRVAVISDGVEPVLRLGHVVRGDAPEIDLPVTIPFEGTVTDVVWSGPTELLLVLKLPDGVFRPYSVSVDGSTVTQGSVTGIEQVAAFAGQKAYALTDVKNVLRQTSVLVWDQVTTGARSVSYPG